MTDLITPVVLLIFGGIMLIVVLAFLMAMREGRPKYERQDYFNKPGGRKPPQERWQQPKDDTSGSYSRGGIDKTENKTSTLRKGFRETLR